MHTLVAFGNRRQPGARALSGLVGILVLMLVVPPTLLQASSPVSSPGPLADWIEELLQTDERLLGAREDLRAAQERERVARGARFPELKLTSDYGVQDNFGDESAVPTGKIDVGVRQLLWDQGVTSVSIATSQLDRVEKEWVLRTVEQTVILDGVSAYINLISAHRNLRFAEQSEENIRRQTGLEEIRVIEGFGYSTDLLQSQSQLAGARSRRLQSEEGYVQAQNRFRELFGWVPGPLELQNYEYPDAEHLTTFLPMSLEDALTRAAEDNLALRIAELGLDRALLGLERAAVERLSPRLDWVSNRIQKYNSGGIRQPDTDEWTTKLEFTLNFNLGLTGQNGLRAAQADLASRRAATENQRKLIERQVRDDWLKKRIALARVESLGEQRSLSAAFLELARRERELGNRTLLEVLSGETALINVRSDEESARAAAVIAILTVLEKFGSLELPLLQ
jgi:adhesin transport system outer membrane protein